MKRSRPAFDSEFSNSSSVESIDDLARRVLFSESLEEKLLGPSRIVSTPTSRLTKTDNFDHIVPGRPSELRLFDDSRPRPDLPKGPALLDEGNRGVLLHFFANHELLAAELMALALLKFPNAPEAFRIGLADTLREEQRHTRWYLARMEECGVTFGEYPVNRFFWDAVSSMESPIDYVSRLSLTFEQANLDYSLHFAGMLETAGDSKSAAILRKIYEDEIDHVGYGLHWFRKWKKESDSDWAALNQRLHFPLSPSRAKGQPAEFNAEGRRRAGFDEDYIRQLSLFERSRGRTPNVFYFNPEAENRMAALPRPYHSPKRVLSIIGDLEILPAFLTRKDDVLLMRRPPSEGHLQRLKSAGFVLPEFVPLNADGTLDKDGLLSKRKIHEFRPWAKAPDLPSLFAALVEGSTGRTELGQWDDKARQTFSKIEQTETFRRWMGDGYACQSGAELAGAAERLLDEGHTEGMLKRAFSTAGGGNRRVQLHELVERSDQPLSENILGEGGILLEPLHSRVLDFSIQGWVTPDKVKFLGPVEQVVTESGAYRGSVCANKFCQGMDPELARFAMNEALSAYSEEGPLAAAICHWASNSGYSGPFGIDAYIHRAATGELRIRTMCEINTRFTMGRVALELRRRIAPGFALLFEIAKAEETDLATCVPETDPKGRMNGGSLILNELHPTAHYAAKLTVAKHRRDL